MKHNSITPTPIPTPTTYIDTYIEQGTSLPDMVKKISEELSLTKYVYITGEELLEHILNYYNFKIDNEEVLLEIEIVKLETGTIGFTLEIKVKVTFHPKEKVINIREEK